MLGYMLYIYKLGSKWYQSQGSASDPLNTDPQTQPEYLVGTCVCIRPPRARYVYNIVCRYIRILSHLCVYYTLFIINSNHCENTELGVLAINHLFAGTIIVYIYMHIVYTYYNYDYDFNKHYKNMKYPCTSAFKKKYYKFQNVWI